MSTVATLAQFSRHIFQNSLAAFRAYTVQYIIIALPVFVLAVAGVNEQSHPVIADGGC